MSIAEQILRDAIGASQRARDDHHDSVRKVAARFAELIGKPWKWRIDALHEFSDSDGEDEVVLEERGRI